MMVEESFCDMTLNTPEKLYDAALYTKPLASDIFTATDFEGEWRVKRHEEIDALPPFPWDQLFNLPALAAVINERKKEEKRRLKYFKKHGTHVEESTVVVNTTITTYPPPPQESSILDDYDEIYHC
ncbi:MAG: hypothetical protein GY835_09975 [bacterium]|nr:hypothetical protein [bacterium]